MIIIYALLIFILIVSVFLAVYGSEDNSSYDEDAVIVLGYGIKKGKIPLMLKNRLDKTIDYHRKNPDAIIIVSGGRGNETKPSEADVMKEYLVANGIPDSIVIKEDKSGTTVENFKFSADILRKKFIGNCSVALITNTFHIYRSERYARAFGINVTHIGAKTNPCDILWIYVREVAMLVQIFFIIGRINK